LVVEAAMSEMEPLDPLSKELLEAARHGHVAPDGGRERVRGRIVARVGLATFGGAAIATAAGTGWLKIAIPIGVLLFGTSAYFVARRPPAAADPVPVVATVTASAISSTDGVTVPELAFVPTTAPPPREIATTKPAPKPPPVASAMPAPPSIEEETALLLGAQSALRDGDSAKALGLLDDHARKFPNGALAEEREATRVLALCAAGRIDDAKKLGRAFLSEHPRSPAASRVRSSCGGG
jgi:hypothetical protein